METIYCFLPQDPGQYQWLLDTVTPELDRRGISFHVARPGEDPLAAVFFQEKKEELL